MVFIAQLGQEHQVGYPRIRSLGRDLSFLSSPLIIFGNLSSRIMFIIGLTIITFSDVFANKDHVFPKLSLVNVLGLNFLLRLEIFVSEDN